MRSPGTGSVPPPAPVVILNEIMAQNLTAVNNGGTFPDWIELHNPGTGAVNLVGWSLSDDSNARKFVFPSFNFPASGHLVVWCDATTNTTASFALTDLLEPEARSRTVEECEDGEVVVLSDRSGAAPVRKRCFADPAP